MAGRGGGTNRNVSKVTIHKRNGTLTISQGGASLTQYLSPRFQNPDEAQRFYEQQGYDVMRNRRKKVSLIKYESS